MKPDLRTLGLAAALFCCGCAPVLDQGRALAVAPYTISDSGLIVIQARIDGHGPFDFALDTAASISVILDQLGERLELHHDPGKRIRVYGAVTSDDFPLLTVGRLEVGNEVWANARIVSMPIESLDRAGIDGLLGVDFLRRYAVGFSLADRAIRLFPPDLVSHESYRGWTAIPLEPVYVGDDGAALYTFEIRIGNENIPAVFDLGAGLNILNWSAAESLGIEPDRVRGDTEFSGAIESVPLVARIKAERVTAGNIRWRNKTFSVVDLGIFRMLSEEDGPGAILGAGLFIQRDFIIDFPRLRLLVKTSMREADDTAARDLSRSPVLSPVIIGPAGMRE